MTLSSNAARVGIDFIVKVEFRDNDGKWHVERGADAELVFPNSYQVTFSISPMWMQHASVLEAMAYRIEGRLCSRAYVEALDASKLTMTMLVAQLGGAFSS